MSKFKQAADLTDKVNEKRFWGYAEDLCSKYGTTWYAFTHKTYTGPDAGQVYLALSELSHMFSLELQADYLGKSEKTIRTAVRRFQDTKKQSK